MLATRLASGDGEGIVKVWNITTACVLFTLTGHKEEVSFFFSLDRHYHLRRRRRRRRRPSGCRRSGRRCQHHHHSKLFLTFKIILANHFPPLYIDWQVLIFRRRKQNFVCIKR